MAPEGNADNGGAPLLSRKGEHLGSATADMAKYSIPEHGYALTGNPADGTGGWLAHRRDVDVPGSGPGNDWVLDLAPMSTEALRKYGTDLSAAMSFRLRDSHAPRMLVLYGSLRPTSFSRKCAYECARILEVMGADVRVYNPKGLPPRDPTELEAHPKVVELRNLALWSESHVWVSPEMHGTITGVFKNQIDWIPLNTGSVRPTQGRTCAVLQVNGGSQSFNVVNELRRLARWMRMICTTNQSSIAKAWQEFDDDGRLKDSSYRDRLIDVMEEHFKMTVLTRTHADFLVDRFSERREIVAKGKLLTQAEKEAEKEKMAAPHTALDDVLPKCCDNPGPGCVPDPGWLELKEEALAEAAAKEAGQGRP